MLEMVGRRVIYNVFFEPVVAWVQWSRVANDQGAMATNGSPRSPDTRMGPKNRQASKFMIACGIIDDK